MDQNPHCKRLHRQQCLLELPQELLWTILGLLDVLSLCTARLVCKQFRQSASGYLKALQLDCTALEQPPTSTITQLSGLTHVAVSVACEKRLHLLAHPHIAPIVTHVDLTLRMLPEDWQGTDHLDQLMLLPALRSISLQVVGRGIKLLPVGLEELYIKDLLQESASLTRFSRLSSLGIHLAHGAGHMLEPLTSLRDLRSLELYCDSSAVAMLSTFTMLTALSLQVCMPLVDIGPELSLVNLARLTALSRLTVCDLTGEWAGELRHEHLACLSLLTGLTHLDINACQLAECVVGSSFLVPLTGLISLGLHCGTVGMSLLPGLKVEALQSLTLRCAEGDVEGDVSVLQRATGLTQFEFVSCGAGCLHGLELALAKMLRLQSLWLCLQDEDRVPRPFPLTPVLRALTSLTRLRYTGRFTAGTELSACASLPGLRNLCLMGVPEITPASLPALHALSGLTELSLLDTGISLDHVTPEVVAAFDVERLSRGWPPLRLEVEFKEFW